MICQSCWPTHSIEKAGEFTAGVLVEHYHVYRKHGLWLSNAQSEKLDDCYTRAESPMLHSHSIDAAQQGFYDACKVARANRAVGAKYPHHVKTCRTTVWKNSGIRVKAGNLLLSLALCVALPEPLRDIAKTDALEMRLVYHISAGQYNWHLVIENRQTPAENTAQGVMAGDLGEVHPIVLSDGHETVVISARELRSVKQYTNKRLAELRHEQAGHDKGSRRWWRLQKRINRFVAAQKRRTHDMKHKISQAVVAVAQERQIKTLAVGDVRTVADGKRLNAVAQQKVSQWSHGSLRQLIAYKAEAVGIVVHDKVNEAYTSQTCPNCAHRTKPKGRVYTCPACGLVAHRDGVGAVNILSRFLYAALAKIPMPAALKYRHPILKSGKRSPVDTRQVVRSRSHRRPRKPRKLKYGGSQEAARLQP